MNLFIKFYINYLSKKNYFQTKCFHKIQKEILDISYLVHQKHQSCL